MVVCVFATQQWQLTVVVWCVCVCVKAAKKKATNWLLHHMTRPGPILRGVQIYLRLFSWHALESGLFPLSQHPINTYRVRAVPLVLDPQLLPR